MTDQLDDNQLLQAIDATGHLWVIRGGSFGVFGAPCTTLKEALIQAHQISSQGNSPGPIVQMPEDAIEVPAEQIYRLWQRLGLKVG
jgi:hypothetical protein